MPRLKEIDNVVIHPLVLLAAVDHYNRVAKDTKKRVVGVLLGEVHNQKVDVLNSFAVPFEEDRKDPSIQFLDHNFHENMYKMFRKVNAKEKVVGQYSTGPKICPADHEITELFRKYTKNPILVIIDVQPKDDLTIPTEAYCSVESQDEEKSKSERTFQHIQTEIAATEPEEIGVEHLLRDIRDKTISTLTTKIDHKIASLQNLKKYVYQMEVYFDNICNKRLPVNPKIIYLLQDIFNLSPNLKVESIVKAFAVKGNDMMLVIYLSSLIRAIIALHNLINNHQMNKDAEISNKEDKEKKDTVAEQIKNDKNDKQQNGEMDLNIENKNNINDKK